MTAAISRRPAHAFSRPRFGAEDVSRTRRSSMHWFSLALVWITFATSGFVFSEPAPVDALSIGLVLLLPSVGLTRITPQLVIYLAAWLVVAAGHFIASAGAGDIASAAKFSGVSLFLYVTSFVFGAFVAARPVAHTRLVLNGWTCAAVLAAMLAIIGYFGVLPGAQDLFTKFGRGSGMFKDPNVFGAFLVAPTVYLLHLAITRPMTRIAGPLCIAGLLSLGVLLCFSRGAWFNLACAISIYGYLSFVTASGAAARARITSFLMIGVLTGVIVVISALQFDQVADLLWERASLVQSYDSGHEGRFGGQIKAIGLIAGHPLGLGANEFGTQYHHEEVHNVYLSVVLNAGWLGGGVYWIMVALTAVLGVRHCLIATPTRPVFLVLFAAFLGTALEGLIVDTDHWRHFYLLMGMCWGLMNCAPAGHGSRARSRA